MENIIEKFNNEGYMLFVKDKNKIIYPNILTSEYNSFLKSSNLKDMTKKVFGKHSTKKRKIYYDESTLKWFEYTSRIIIIEAKKYCVERLTDITPFYSYVKNIMLSEDNISSDLLKFHYDSTTSLFNKDYTLELLTKKIYEASQGIYKISIVMGDLDFFKKINDEYGHVIGDKVLNVVGSLLKSSVRYNDFVGRFGGEEFLIVFQKADGKIINKRVEDIRKKISEEVFTSVDGRIFKTSMSFGIYNYIPEKVLYNSEDNDAITERERALSNADKALYKSKETGRNKITNYSDMSI